MRYLSLLLVPVVAFACAKGEQTQEDAAAGAAALTEADVAGTWTGTSMAMGSDSVLAHWTQTCANGACTETMQEVPDTVASTYTISGDSAMGTSAPFMSPVIGANVVSHWTVRLQDGKAVGTGTLTLADNPDSTVMRYHFEGTRGAGM